MPEETKKILGSVAILPEILQEVDSQIKDVAAFQKKIQEYASKNITQLLDLIMYGAIALDASDVHLEP